MSQAQLDAFIAVVRADPAWQQRLLGLDADPVQLAETVRGAGYDLSDPEILWLTTCQDWMSEEPPTTGADHQPLGIWG